MWLWDVTEAGFVAAQSLAARFWQACLVVAVLAAAAVAWRRLRG